MLSRVQTTSQQQHIVISDQTLYSSLCRADFPKPMPSERGKVSRNVSASMTAECAAVLPLFLMAIVTLLFFIDLLGTASAKRPELTGQAEYLASGPAGPEWVDLYESCAMSLPFPLPGIRQVRIPVRVRVRRWRGADEDTFAGAESPSGGKAVYVTDYESVYHTRPDCTHLALTVLRSDTSHVSALRNTDGKKYRKCDGFPSGYEGPVYLTPNGDRYYPSPDYAGLTRHVHIKTSEDVAGLSLCERCAHAS